MNMQIQQFLENSGSYVTTKFSDGISVRAISQNETDLQYFQPIAQSLVEAANDGQFIIYRTLTLKEYSVDYIYIVLIKWLD